MKSRAALVAAAVSVLAMVSGCAGVEEAAELTLPAVGNAATGQVSTDQKRRAEQFTSIFENDTIELQYGYIEALGDGRGYTAGRAGFTSGTGDMLLVVEQYAAAQPGNALSQFLPRLRQLAAAESGSIVGLGGLPQAWEVAADDSKFRTVQDAVVDQEYFQPALEFWSQTGLKTALSFACYYDAIIQHGGGDDHDGLPAMIGRTTRQVGGTPGQGASESQWLAAFLEVREATLSNAANRETRAEWAESVDRVQAERAILLQGNFDLHGPIEIATKNHRATIP